MTHLLRALARRLAPDWTGTHPHPDGGPGPGPCPARITCRYSACDCPTETR